MTRALSFWGIVLAICACGDGPPGGAAREFAANPNGLSFENYSNDGVTNLTSVEMRRLFGDAVCASLAGGECTLTPAASQWMAQANGMMNGGHCFGISHFVSGVYSGAINPQAFGGATAYELSKGNEAVQREIAFWMATQLTSPANASIVGARPIPSQMLNALVEGWGRGEQFTLAFFNRTGAGGHAVTPISVTSSATGLYELKLYDNNHPGVERTLLVDPATEEWAYSAATNPNEPESTYDGDASTKSLFIVPLKDAQGPQQCPFCGDASATSAMSGERVIGATGGGDLRIDDGAGHSIGTDGNVLTNKFPGARAERPISADLYKDNTEPIYYLPGGTDLHVVLDGKHLTSTAASEVAVVGPGYALAVTDIALGPGQRDTIDVSAMGDGLTYSVAGTESPTVLHGFSTSGADFLVAAKVASDQNGSVFSLTRNAMTLRLTFLGAGSTRYGFVLARIEANAVQKFLHVGESLGGDATLVIDLLSWPGNGQPLTVGIDMGSDGTVDSTVQLADED